MFYYYNFLLLIILFNSYSRLILTINNFINILIDTIVKKERIDLNFINSFNIA